MSAPDWIGQPHAAELADDHTVSAAPYGSASILPITWAYIRMMGAAGLRAATLTAIASANYIARRLDEHYPVLYTGENGMVAHECILDLRAITKATGVTVDDVDLLELYDSYTYTVLVTLEDYGFCPKGEGGKFVSDGKLGPGGSLPCNTGGGQLSSYYLTGFTPIVEAVIQGRGHAGERQVGKKDVIMVSGSGGILEHHATLVLGGSR